ncbi:cytidylate kinase [Denitrovibrio acetiphilus DSM 12809]|uniref:Cytidylate kinase n=1 Tax=Denitrovibrio acetiphilus (strain DSM 12809 / NBRC 114555 / N2460) TaxID=522772 RepID=D4H6M9_DENA2|nr:(d)CMP kinase [Denitrovibrio acetiphilus]ADD69703.1 cytidylate kinase [Denitrovibrio acetiphilus DSM 12809]
MIIAVDGPAGSGKSTVSKEVAKRLGITFLDSGALYRTCAYIKLTHKMSDEELIRTVRNAKMAFSKDGSLNLTINDKTENVSGKIRTPQVAEAVSSVAAMPEIREAVTNQLRQMSETDSVIMDGRDIGTCVFPNADYKFYLSASSLERAKRRMKDYEAQGIEMSINELVREIDERDRKDSEREHAPLKKADDAIEIDTTHLTIEEVISIIAAKTTN